MAVDLTRLLTSSVADLVEDHFESDAMRGVLSVSGVIGTWAGPRSAGTAYVMLHHHVGDVGDGQTGAWGFPRGGMGGVSNAIASAAARSAPRSAPTPASPGSTRRRGPSATGVVLETGEVLTAPTVITTAHPQIAFLRLLDRRDLPADFVEEIETWKTRSGTVKVNFAVDRLPEFTSKPGFDPEVHGGTIVLAESLDDIESAYQEAVTGGRRRCRSPTSAFPASSTTPSRRPATTSSRCSPSGCRTPGTPSRTRPSSTRTPTAWSPGWTRWRPASPTRCCTAR